MSEDAKTDTGERIAKFLARAGVASRRDAEKIIAEGRVAVNGTTLDTPAFKVTPEDIVTLDGKPVAAGEATRLWIYHKPRGLVTTHKDPQGRPTVFQSLPPGLPRVISVGRLDLNSEGLLLLTNDGELARRLELPSSGWARRYRVRIFGKPSEATIASMGRGVTVEDVNYGPVQVAVDREQGSNCWIIVTLREGKNREIRKLFEHFGHSVSRLIRTSYGPFQLGQLPEGAVKEVPGKVLREQLGRKPEDGPMKKTITLKKAAPQKGRRSKP